MRKNFTVCFGSEVEKGMERQKKKRAEWKKRAE